MKIRQGQFAYFSYICLIYKIIRCNFSSTNPILPTIWPNCYAVVLADCIKVKLTEMNEYDMKY